MKNLVYNGYTYSRLFILNDEILIKYSMLPQEVWESIKDKELSFLNVPSIVTSLSDEEKKRFPKYLSKIYLPKLNGYKTLYNETFTRNLTTEDMLNQLRYLLLNLKQMHLKKTFHNDLYANNIMINKDFDISFIDLDQLVIDDFISRENIYSEDGLRIREVRKLCRIQDKIDIFSLYMYYLINGDFKKEIMDNVNIKVTDIPLYIQKEIDAYLSGDATPNGNYYFIDIVDELIKIGYESPTLKLRRGNDHV